MRALIILAQGFEECEALCVYDVLKRGGIEPVLVGMDGSEIRSSHSVKIRVDEVLSEKTLDKDYSVVFLPGGMPGAKNLFSSALVTSLVKDANERGRIVGAICASPAVVLGPLGILSGHKATCFPGCESFYPSFDFSSDGVVVSGNVITGKSAGYAFDTALKILEVLCGSDVKEKVQNEIYYKEGEKI